VKTSTKDVTIEEEKSSHFQGKERGDAGLYWSRGPPQSRLGPQKKGV